MTVPVADNKTLQACDGVKDYFTFNFKYRNNSSIYVYIVNADGTLTPQTEGVHYSLSSADKNTGGTVTFGTAPAADKHVFIIRTEAFSQETPFKPNTNFPEQIIEDSLDKLTMIVQQLAEVDTRCIKLPINSEVSNISMPIPETGKVLIGNDNGTGFINSNVDIEELTSSLQQAESSANSAAISAANALISENNASASEISAAESATEAAGYSAAVNLPSAVGNGLNYLRQKSTEDGFEYRTPVQVIEDIDVQTHINNVLDGFFPINGFEINTIETQLTGTVSTTSGSATLTGSGTLFTTEAPTGTQLLIGGESYSVSSVASNTSLTLSSNAVSTLSAVNYHSISNSISVSSGKCRDITDSINIQTSTTLIKKLGVNWVAGNNQGGFIPVSGHTSKEALTQYNVFAVTIPSGGTNDICMIHLSACDGEYLTPAGKVSMAAVMGWTEDELYYRRIACLRTGFTGNILPVTQFGDRFDYKVRIPARALSASSDTLGHLWGISTPYGIKTEALINGFFNTSGTSYLNLQNPEEIDIFPDATSSILSTSNGSFNVNVVTNTASQIRYRTSNTSFTFSLNLKGYIDRRGKK